jgi:hypothetical protein
MAEKLELLNINNDDVQAADDERSQAVQCPVSDVHEGIHLTCIRGGSPIRVDSS